MKIRREDGWNIKKKMGDWNKLLKIEAKTVMLLSQRGQNHLWQSRTNTSHNNGLLSQKGVESAAIARAKECTKPGRKKKKV